jgi:hypothetical protein
VADRIFIIVSEWDLVVGWLGTFSELVGGAFRFGSGEKMLLLLKNSLLGMVWPEVGAGRYF